MTPAPVIIPFFLMKHLVVISFAVALALGTAVYFFVTEEDTALMPAGFLDEVSGRGFAVVSGNNCQCRC